MLKLRWTNGWGDDSGNYYPYHYYLENLETGEKIPVDARKVELVAKSYNDTINRVFRGSNAKKACEDLLFISKYDVYETMPDGWCEIAGAMTAPLGFKWIFNNTSVFSKNYKSALLKI